MLPRFARVFSGVRRILKLMALAILGVSVSRSRSSSTPCSRRSCPAAACRWLYYADRLMEFPAGMLGRGPRHDPAAQPVQDARRRKAVRVLVAARLGPAPHPDDHPARRAGLALLAVPLIATLFHHGAFTPPTSSRPARADRLQRRPLTGLILVKVLAPAFYARQDVLRR